MGKKGSNPLPTFNKPPAPPNPPPLRTFRQGWFSFAETPESIKATEEWDIYIKAYGNKS